MSEKWGPFDAEKMASLMKLVKEYHFIRGEEADLESFMAKTIPTLWEKEYMVSPIVGITEPPIRPHGKDRIRAALEKMPVEIDAAFDEDTALVITPASSMEEFVRVFNRFDPQYRDPHVSYWRNKDNIGIDATTRDFLYRDSAYSVERMFLNDKIFIKAEWWGVSVGGKENTTFRVLIANPKLHKTGQSLHYLDRGTAIDYDITQHLFLTAKQADAIFEHQCVKAGVAEWLHTEDGLKSVFTTHGNFLEDGTNPEWVCVPTPMTDNDLLNSW
jgi:hypothetical protein